MFAAVLRSCVQTINLKTCAAIYLLADDTDKPCSYMRYTKLTLNVDLNSG